MAGSLGEALDCLEKDHEFLLKGDVFTKDFLDMWISTKRKEHRTRCACVRIRMSFSSTTTCKAPMAES